MILGAGKTKCHICKKSWLDSGNRFVTLIISPVNMLASCVVKFLLAVSCAICVSAD